MVRSKAHIEAEIADAERRINKQMETLAKMREELGKAPELPAEPDVSAVIKFQVQHSADGPVYSYVAHRFPAIGEGDGYRWVIAGPRHGNTYYSWEQVLDLICEDVAVKIGARKPSFYLFETGKTIEAH